MESKGNDEVSEIPEATADLCSATDSTEPSDNSPPTSIQNPLPAKRQQVSLSLKGRCKSKENKEMSKLLRNLKPLLTQLIVLIHLLTLHPQVQLIGFSLCLI